MATYEETLAATIAILERHVEDGRPVRAADHAQNDLGLDSLGIMEVVADVEDRFAVSIPNERLPEIATVDDIVKTLLGLDAKL